GAAEPRQQADQRVDIGSASAADPRQGGGGYACLASDRTPTEAVAAAASVERDVQRVGVESDLHTTVLSGWWGVGATPPRRRRPQSAARSRQESTRRWLPANRDLGEGPADGGGDDDHGH